MTNPFEWYVEQYNMVGRDRRKAAYRFSKHGWESLMQYKEWEKEAAVKEAMRAPELEILKRWRHREISCNECFGGSFWGGSAITGWQCEICKTDHMHGNTNTPRICVGCAISNFKCQRCTKSLDESL